uniref:C-type lectin domain-containing protein n=1 Tax=Cyprinus carpio TaxID=7962 RepID=A0A8C1IJT0_CYPCA
LHSFLLKTDGCAFLRPGRKKLHDKECTAEYPAFCMTNFVLMHQNETWEGALEYCRTHYNDLASLKEQSFLEDAAHQPSDAWVGLYTESGIWKWSGGENATQISWDINQPGINNICAFLCKYHKTLHYAECTDKYAFFCMNVSEFVLLCLSVESTLKQMNCRKSKKVMFYEIKIPLP